MTPKAHWPLFKTSYFVALLRKSADYYHREAGGGTAEKFLSAVDTAIGMIAHNPYSAPRYMPPVHFEELAKLHYRKLSLANFSAFPYTIYYEIEVDRIVIQSIYHDARNREQMLTSEL